MFTQKPPGTDSRLGPGDTFSFECHSALSCFNTCCRNKHLPLTPYDVLRLKQGLRMHSDAFLTRYTLYWMSENTGFPCLCLRMGQGPGKPCPFVTEKGCGVYADRPTACRLYPLGRAVGAGSNESGDGPFYFQMDTPGCLGTGQPKKWRVADWAESQGLGEYVEMNDRMLDVVFHPARDRRSPLTERQIQKVMVACYNLDIFRELVLTPSFSAVYSLDNGTRERVTRDDKALLELGMAYLKGDLFGKRGHREDNERSHT